MKIDRYFIIVKARDAGATWEFIAKMLGISYTRVRQIYFKNDRLKDLASKNSRIDAPINLMQ